MRGRLEADLRQLALHEVGTLTDETDIEHEMALAWG